MIFVLGDCGVFVCWVCEWWGGGEIYGVGELGGGGVGCVGGVD